MTSHVTIWGGARRRPGIRHAEAEERSGRRLTARARTVTATRAPDACPRGFSPRVGGAGQQADWVAGSLGWSRNPAARTIAATGRPVHPPRPSISTSPRWQVPLGAGEALPRGTPPSGWSAHAAMRLTWRAPVASPARWAPARWVRGFRTRFLAGRPRSAEVEVRRVGDLLSLRTEVAHGPDLRVVDVDAGAVGEDDARAVRGPVGVGVAASGRAVVGEPDGLGRAVAQGAAGGRDGRDVREGLVRASPRPKDSKTSRSIVGPWRAVDRSLTSASSA